MSGITLIFSSEKLETEYFLFLFRIIIYMQTLPDTWELHTLLLDKINAPPVISFDYDVNDWINNLQNRKCKKRFLHPLSESFEDTIIMNIKKVLDEMSQEEIENITSFKVLLNNF